MSPDAPPRRKHKCSLIKRCSIYKKVHRKLQIVQAKFKQTFEKKDHSTPSCSMIEKSTSPPLDSAVPSDIILPKKLISRCIQSEVLRLLHRDLITEIEKREEDKQHQIINDLLPVTRFKIESKRALLMAQRVSTQKSELQRAFEIFRQKKEKHHYKRIQNDVKVNESRNVTKLADNSEEMTELEKVLLKLRRKSQQNQVHIEEGLPIIEYNKTVSISETDLRNNVEVQSKQQLQVPSGSLKGAESDLDNQDLKDAEPDLHNQDLNDAECVLRNQDLNDAECDLRNEDLIDAECVLRNQDYKEKLSSTNDEIDESLYEILVPRREPKVIKELKEHRNEETLDREIEIDLSRPANLKDSLSPVVIRKISVIEPKADDHCLKERIECQDLKTSINYTLVRDKSSDASPLVTCSQLISNLDANFSIISDSEILKGGDLYPDSYDRKLMIYNTRLPVGYGKRRLQIRREIKSLKNIEMESKHDSIVSISGCNQNIKLPAIDENELKDILKDLSLNENPKAEETQNIDDDD